MSTIQEQLNKFNMTEEVNNHIKEMQAMQRINHGGLQLNDDGLDSPYIINRPIYQAINHHSQLSQDAFGHNFIEKELIMNPIK